MHACCSVVKREQSKEQVIEENKTPQDKVPQNNPLNLNTTMKITALLRATRGNL